MKIINNEKGYTTSILLLTLLIPIILLTIITIEEYNHQVDNTVENLQSNKLKSVTEDFENEIIILTKKSIHNITKEVTTTKKALTNSEKTIKDDIQDRINQLQLKYQKENIIIETTITDVKASDDPFKIEIEYNLKSTANNSNMKIEKTKKEQIEITDKNYPVYDPLPTLKTGVTLQNNQINYKYRLYNYININNSEVYINTTQQVIIRKCPYHDYIQHGNDNGTIKNCINNQYYHNSHDGMCIFCRLENKTSCNHYGFETFIIPTKIVDKAPASIDHVLLNNPHEQYSGNNININNTTIIYLDDGHKQKYGL